MGRLAHKSASSCRPRSGSRAPRPGLSRGNVRQPEGQGHDDGHRTGGDCLHKEFAEESVLRTREG